MGDYLQAFKKNAKFPKKFYIAHRIIDRDTVRRLCKRFQAIGIETINPFYRPDGSHRPERPEILRIDEGKQDPYFIRNKNKAINIVQADLQHIEKCDGTIAFIKQASIGTSMEIFYTKRVLGKYVFVITEKYYKHAWILTFSDKIFRTPDEFMKWYAQEKKKIEERNNGK